MLVLTHASLATVAELFRYKSQNFQLPDFPGYTMDQWGIKAHNRPWIEEAGGFAKGQRILEVGGAYSLLPKYLADKYQLEAWIGDDFGVASSETMWSRWGDPKELPAKYPEVKYIFERFGIFSPQYPESYFDRIFSVSTLEHLQEKDRLEVFRDMHRCLKPGGREIHSIDIPTCSPREMIKTAFREKLGGSSEIRRWIDVIQASGVRIEARIPNSLNLLDRGVLVESPDVVYRFYPPNNAPKYYLPSGSLLIIIENK